MTNRPSDTPEAVGAYRDKGSDTNWLPWVIGLIVLALLIALLWWAMSGDDTVETTDPAVTTTPNEVYEGVDDPAGAPPLDPTAEPAVTE